MTTKVCPNSQCPAFAHLVYTVAMRCVLCRCDLQAPHRSAAVTGVRPGNSVTNRARVTALRKHP